MIATFMNSTLIYKDLEPIQSQILEAVLKSNQLISTYRYKFRSYLNMEYAIDLLLFDDNNPRSISYQLQKLMVYLNNLSEKEDGQGQEFLKILESYTLIKTCEKPHLLVTETDNYIRENLKELLEKLALNITACSLAITEKYFSHSASVQSLVYPN